MGGRQLSAVHAFLAFRRFDNPQAGLSVQQAMRLPAYWLLVAMFTLTILGPSFSVSFYKVFGEEFIKDDKFFATVNSVSSLFNAGGRFFWGYLVDRQPYKVAIPSAD